MPFDSWGAQSLESVLHSNIEAAGVHMAQPVKSVPNAMTKGRDFIITVPADFGDIQPHQITREVVLDFQKDAMSKLAETLAKNLTDVGRFDADAQADPISEPLEIRTVQDRKSGNFFHCIKLSGEIAHRIGLLQPQDKKAFDADERVHFINSQSPSTSSGALAQMKADRADLPPVSRQAYQPAEAARGEQRIIIKPGKPLGLGA